MYILAATTILLMAAGNVEGDCGCHMASYKEDPQVISAIEGVLREWPRHSVPEAEGEAMLAGFLDSLRKASNNDEEHLVQQFFLLYFREIPNFKNEERPFRFIGLLHQLKAPPLVYIEALHPYLCSSDETELLWAQRLMYYGSSQDQIDLDPHEQIIREALQESRPVPVGLVRELFRRLPCHALLLIARVEPELSTIREQLGWATEEPVCNVEDPKLEFTNHGSLPQSLQKLSINDKWWIRLWVAEFLKLSPELRDQSVWKRLQEDRCEVVRQSVTGKGVKPK